MSGAATLERVVLAVILLAVLTVSPGTTAGFGSGNVPGEPPVGDGTATVAVEAFPADRLVIDGGRFGTGAAYLRIPDVAVDVSDATGRSRIVYRVAVPALDASVTEYAAVKPTTAGRLVVGGTDRALAPDGLAADTYEARIELRIQSFAEDRTVVSRTVAVEVRA